MSWNLEMLFFNQRNIYADIEINRQLNWMRHPFAWTKRRFIWLENGKTVVSHSIGRIKETTLFVGWINAGSCTSALFDVGDMFFCNVNFVWMGKCQKWSNVKWARPVTKAAKNRRIVCYCSNTLWPILIPKIKVIFL